MTGLWENRDLSDLEGELWKDVVGYEGLYMVSNLGRVKSLDFWYNADDKWNRVCRKPVKILKQKIGDKVGYLIVSISLNKNKKTATVHRIVANAWLERASLKPQVDHIDGNPLNNKYENLRWCNNRENCSWRSNNLTTSSDMVGVCFDKSRGKWLSKIRINKYYQLNISRFDREVNAEKAYNDVLLSLSDNRLILDVVSKYRKSKITGIAFDEIEKAQKEKDER